MRIAVVLALVLAAGCSKSDAPPSAEGQTRGQAQAATRPSTVGTKDPAAAKQLIASGATVIDVRTPEEFQGGHLAQAANIPVDDLGGRIADIEKLVGGDKSKPIVLYCHSGRRATRAQQALLAAGYTQVVNGGGYADLQ